jgi:hypothetical protein
MKVARRCGVALRVGFGGHGFDVVYSKSFVATHYAPIENRLLTSASSAFCPKHTVDKGLSQSTIGRKSTTIFRVCANNFATFDSCFRRSHTIKSCWVFEFGMSRGSEKQ